MRFAKIKYAHYGVFHNKELLLAQPAGGDFHFVFGLNEAGKTTALTGISDWLFGIPHNPPYPGELLLEAEVQQDGDSHYLRRRKGRKNALLDKDDTVFDGLPQDWLGGIGRDGFGNMFGLSHEKLRIGGDDLVSNGGNFGAVMFSAKAGLTGLRGVLSALEKECDDNWGPRARQARRYQMAKVEYESAAKRKKEAESRPEELRKLQELLKGLRQQKKDARQKYERCRNRLKAINRILSARPHLRKAATLQQELNSLQDAPKLPADARAITEHARGAEREAGALLDACRKQITALKREIDKIKLSRAILENARAIGEIDDKRASVRIANADIPKRQSEIGAEQKRVAELMRQIGIANGENFSIPPDSRMQTLEKLADDGAQMDASIAALTKQVAQSTPDDAKQNAAAVASLQDAIRNARAEEASTHIRAEEKQSRILSREIQSELSLLACVWTGDAAQLDALAVPLESSVDKYNDMFASLKEKQWDIDSRAKTIGNEIKKLEKERAEVAASGEVVSEEDITQAREARDEKWRDIRGRYMQTGKHPQNKAADSPAQTADAFEELLGVADDAADKRYQNSEQSIRLDRIARDMREALANRDEINREQKALDKERARADKAWQGEWRGAGINPRTPREMKEWLAKRAETLRLWREQAEKDANINRMREGMEKAARSLSEAVLACGGAASKEQPLAQLIGKGEVLEKEIADARARRKAAEEQQKKARADLARAETEKEKWLKKLQRALGDCGLDRELEIDGLREKLACLREIGESRRNIGALEKRVSDMQADVGEFKAGVLRLAKTLALPEQNGDAFILAQKMAQMLQDEQNRESRRQDLLTNLRQQEKEEAENQSRVESAQAELQPLMKQASAKNADELLAAIDKTEQRREVKKDMGEVQRELIALPQGGGKTPEQLKQESDEGAEDGELQNEQAQLEGDISDLGERENELTARIATAERDLQAITGGEDAAVAEADRQSALSGMTEAFERYARAKIARQMLQAAMDKSNDGDRETVKRAGELFCRLTEKSFTGIEIIHRDDGAVLVGVSEERGEVFVDAMSDGTRDQMYFALRVAALEARLQSGGAKTPFIADDLFVNFDDRRAKAGFLILGELAKQTQVLFFSHHEHLRNIARETLGDISVQELRTGQSS